MPHCNRRESHTLSLRFRVRLGFSQERPGLSVLPSIGPNAQVAPKTSDNPNGAETVRAISVSPIHSRSVRTMQFTQDVPGLLEASYPSVSSDFGFDAAGAHAQVLRLSLVGLFARLQPSLGGDRYRLMLRVGLAGVLAELPLDSVYEVSVVMSHMSKPYQSPSLAAEFERRLVSLVSLPWLGGF